ncbi:MAG: sortase A [Bacteroidia bacterium]|jgi:sortase A
MDVLGRRFSPAIGSFNKRHTLTLLKMLKQKYQWLFAAVLVTAAFFLASALWIPVKAKVAQFLLENAWQRTLAGEIGAKPWPWADTSPVGVLEVATLGIRLIVLSGTSGRNLAFGPTLHSPPEENDKILSGHRDTHFRFLESVKIGEILRVTTVHGALEYRISWLEVIDSDVQELVLEPDVSRLTLTTCYPFDSPSAGGSLRYVVTAIQVS